jgi:prepilin-type N-terminal cleavage/methylation domain-containing protein
MTIGPPSRNRAGFTLVELLVVIAIIGTLVGLLLPAVQSARESARRQGCSNNLKQIGLALLQHHEARGSLPAGYTSAFDLAGNDTGPGWGWAARILPYLEQGQLFAGIDFNQPIESAAAVVRTAVVPTFLCPTDAVATTAFPVGPRSATGQLTATTCSLAPANYIGSFGVGEPGIDGDGLFYRGSGVRLKDITDGSSTTLAVGERSFRDAEST